MEPSVVQQSAGPLPPRTDKIIPITVDGTSRAYDLWSVAFGTAAVNTAATGTEAPNTRFFITMLADGGDVLHAFGPTSAVQVDEGAVLAPGDPLSYPANAGEPIHAGTRVDWRMMRKEDRYLAIKTLAMGTVLLYIRVSSERDDTKPVLP